MNKLVIRNSIISAVLIILLVIVLLWSDKSPYGKYQSYFASIPKTEITMIEISDDEKKVILSNSKDEWMLNGTKEVRKNEVLFLLRILKEMEIKSPVSPGLFEKEIMANGLKPVKVRVYERKRLLNSFQVYHTASNIYGNIMKKKSRTKPFIVYVPGYEGDIGSQFTTDELFWQPFNIFNLLPSEISSVTLENNLEPHYSFTIVNRNGSFILADSVNCISGWDTARVKRYLTYFTWVPFEAWASDMTNDDKEDILNRDPLFNIKVLMSNGEERELTLWERFDPVSGIIDSDRLWGKINNLDDFFVVRYFDIDPLLRKITYFCKEVNINHGL